MGDTTQFTGVQFDRVNYSEASEATILVYL